jgi:Tfp pilus assembly protein PilF
VPDTDPADANASPGDAASAKTPPAPRAARRLLPKSPKSMADREAEDLDVSKFYLQSGNYLGAYLRAQDAVKSVPDDSEAHFALAQAAQKMKKRDEAIQEYKAYLDLEPDGDHVKTARLALVELSR